MDQKTQALRAFITEKLAEHGLEPDELVFQSVENYITLTEAPGPESEEARSVTLKEASDGKVTADFFSLYNLQRVSLYDLFGVLQKEAAILLMADDPKLKVALSLISVVYDFFPKLTYTFNDTDAKILLIVYQIKQQKITTDQVAALWLQQFGQAIDPAQLTRSLDFMANLKVLEKEKDSFMVRPRMTYARD